MHYSTGEAVVNATPVEAVLPPPNGVVDPSLEAFTWTGDAFGRYQIVVKGPDTWQGPHILFRIDTATGVICRLQTATREGGDMSKGVAWVKSCTDSGQVFDLDGLAQIR